MVALNPSDIIVLVIILAVLFFGAAKIPELFRALGRAKGEFKKGELEAEMELNQMKANTYSSGNTSSDLDSKIKELERQLEELKKQKQGA